jgi:GT2 family glycosyltransferase
MDRDLTRPAEMDRDESWKYVFTIFIPTYNRAHLLPRALDSIAAQTYQDFEILSLTTGRPTGHASW